MNEPGIANAQVTETKPSGKQRPATDTATPQQQNEAIANEYALIAKGMAALNANDWSGAAAAFKELVQLDGMRWEYRKAFGNGQLNLGQYHDAVVSYDAGISLRLEPRPRLRPRLG